MKKVTGHDVAAFAGVSQSTVSRVIAGDSRISRDTRMMVLSAARHLGYDMCSRSGSWSIGVIFGCKVDYFPGYYADVFAAVAKELEQRGIGMELFWENCDWEKITKPFRGMLVLETPDNDNLLNPIYPLPIVRINGKEQVSENISTVNSDIYSGIKQAVRYLWKLGHRDIRFVSLEGKRSELKKRTRRYQGFLDILSELGVPKPEDKTIFFDEGHQTSLKALSKALQKAIDQDCSAIICVNSSHTLKVNAALHSLGIRIPEDLSVIDWEYSGVSAYLDPPRTTISIDFPQMAKRSIDLLCDLINGRAQPHIETVPTLLIQRQSTGKKQNRNRTLKISQQQDLSCVKKA